MYKTAATALAFALLSAPVFAQSGACNAIAANAQDAQIRLNPPSTYQVAGKGRLYFYTAPDKSCRSKDIFVIPNDKLVVHAEFKGWYSVMYINPRTGKDYDGWVRSERLKLVGSIRPGY